MIAMVDWLGARGVPGCPTKAICCEPLGSPTRFDDDGKIVEHWDVLQVVPDRSAHDNGMF